LRISGERWAAEQDGRFSACQADAAPRRFRYFPLGGYGFIKEYPVEKLMRDAKVMQLY
jgi:alkylation response protein AidB-like acyl-CoA dehydrogenase